MPQYTIPSEYGALAEGLQEGFLMGQRLLELRQRKLEFEFQKAQAEQAARFKELDDKRANVALALNQFALIKDLAPIEVLSSFHNSIAPHLREVGINVPDINTAQLTPQVSEALTEFYEFATKVINNSIDNPNVKDPSLAFNRLQVSSLLASKAAEISPRLTPMEQKQLFTDILPKLEPEKITGEERAKLELRHNLTSPKEIEEFNKVMSGYLEKIRPTNLMTVPKDPFTDQVIGLVVDPETNKPSMRVLHIMPNEEAVKDTFKDLPAETGAKFAWTLTALDNRPRMNQLMFDDKGNIRTGVVRYAIQEMYRKLAEASNPSWIKDYVKKIGLYNPNIDTSNISESERSEGRELAAMLYYQLDALLRPITGAAIATTEELRTARLFMPETVLGLLVTQDARSLKANLNTLDRTMAGFIGAVDKRGIHEMAYRKKVQEALRRNQLVEELLRRQKK